MRAVEGAVWKHCGVKGAVVMECIVPDRGNCSWEGRANLGECENLINLCIH